MNTSPLDSALEALNELAQAIHEGRRLARAKPVDMPAIVLAQRRIVCAERTAFRVVRQCHYEGR